MTNKERTVWIHAIRMNVQTINSAINKIRAETAVIDQALTEINEYVKLMESA